MFNANDRRRTYIVIARQAHASERAERRSRGAWMRALAESIASLGSFRAAPTSWPEPRERLADGRDPRW